MKFGELKRDEWPALQPYMDTCLLPVTGLTGRESPVEAADLAARAGAVLGPMEERFRGRTVTMPAFHYYGPEDEGKLSELCRKLKEEAGFRYVVVVTGVAGLVSARVPADLVAEPLPDESPEAAGERWTSSVADLWKKG